MVQNIFLCILVQFFSNFVTKKYNFNSNKNHFRPDQLGSASVVSEMERH
jgi:hypothetical protein